MKSIFVLTVVACVTAGPALGAGACVPGAHDADDAVAALKQAYAAAEGLDEAGWKGSITPDFYAYDGGHRFTGDGMFDIVKSARAAGKVYHWELSGFDAHATCGFVWVAYVNNGGVTTSAGTTKLSWLESAVLRDDDGVWKIAFLHSTRVPEAKPK